MKTYAERVEELEAEGLDRSDAQGVADMEGGAFALDPRYPLDPHKCGPRCPCIGLLTGRATGRKVIARSTKGASVAFSTPQGGRAMK